jgi:hypothetical protein
MAAAERKPPEGVDAEIYRRARERLAARRGFLAHLFVYCAVNAVLFLINLFTTGPWWFYWPLLGWGVGLATHGFVTFMPMGRLGRRWEDEAMAKLIEDERRRADRERR